MWSRFKFIKNIRKQKYDCSVTLFPSNKWYFNVFALLVGARKRVVHQYVTHPLINLGFLQHIRIAVDENLHDVEQNLNLLKAFGGSPDVVDKKLLFYVSDKDRHNAAQYVKENLDSTRKIVGIHIGSSQDFNFAAKRWPTEKFAALADRLEKELDVQVCIFAGPDESSELSELVRSMETTPKIIQQPIKLTASLIEKCDLMISNDSGLMHIAVAMNTHVIAIFGPTNITRTRPYTENATIIYNENCNSLLQYPFTTTSSIIDPEKAKECFESISVERVFLKAKERLLGL
jgi:ADP-heptose:LPS heptosyltransferase